MGKRTSLYNPSLLRRDELISHFAARGDLLAALLDSLRDGERRHHLLIGPSGAGKTTLLLRLAYAIDDDDELARRAIALRFPEEQYNVGQLSDLWLNCLDALVDALERRGLSSEAGLLDEVIDELADLDEGERQRAGLDVLLQWAKRADKRLVLLVDNLDRVLARLADHHPRLRELLLEEPRLAVIGASATFLDEVYGERAPFSQLFITHDLGGLDEEEATAMMRALAAHLGSPRVQHLVEREPGRFKALRLLSGGTPRALTMLAALYAEGTTASAEEDLAALADRLTPHYQARIDVLSPQSQQLAGAVALHWHPVTAAECHHEARFNLNATSALLNRLTKQGVLSKHSSEDSSRLTFQIRDRFFNLWYLMRASRRSRRRLGWLVSFLQRLYGPEHRALTELPAGASLSDEDSLAAAADQLLQSDRHERLLPLYEALRAAARGDFDHLHHLAPEVRAPAEHILRGWKRSAKEGGALVRSPDSPPELPDGMVHSILDAIRHDRDDRDDTKRLRAAKL